jgi:hypothetical protein
LSIDVLLQLLPKSLHDLFYGLFTVKHPTRFSSSGMTSANSRLVYQHHPVESIAMKYYWNYLNAAA